MGLHHNLLHHYAVLLHIHNLHYYHQRKLLMLLVYIPHRTEHTEGLLDIVGHHKLPNSKDSLYRIMSLCHIVKTSMHLHSLNKKYYLKDCYNQYNLHYIKNHHFLSFDSYQSHSNHSYSK